MNPVAEGLNRNQGIDIPRSPNFSATLRVSRCLCRYQRDGGLMHYVTAASVGLRFLPACLHSVLRSHRLRLLARRTQGKAEAQVAAAV